MAEEHAGAGWAMGATGLLVLHNISVTLSASFNIKKFDLEYFRHGTSTLALLRAVTECSVESSDADLGCFGETSETS